MTMQPRYPRFSSSVGPSLVLVLVSVTQSLSLSTTLSASVLAQTLLFSCGVNAFSTSSLPPTRATFSKKQRNRNSLCENFARMNHAFGNALFASASPDEIDSGKQQLVLVLGGSGYIGRRICKELVEAPSSGDGTTQRVVSISRNGKPPSWGLDIGGGNDSLSWSEKVEWIQHDIRSESGEGESSLAEILRGICTENENDSFSSWKTTIVGCIGNVNPSRSWKGLWGLAFEDDLLLEENGRVYESFLNQTESLRRSEEGQEQLLAIHRCVLLSLDYTCQKCLEGPIEGYIDGKRLAERRLLEALSSSKSYSADGERIAINDPSHLENVVVIGLPNFVFGGKRFPNFGKLYRKFVESPVAKAYVGGNNALRSLSVADPEDWVEAMLFSSPLDVEIAGRATAMAARGLVTKDLVNNGEPRKQGFFNTSGLPVEYDDILFVDGAHEIEALVGAIGGEVAKSTRKTTNTATNQQQQPTGSKTEVPLWEGALIGKRPYLFPFPAASFFIYVFWGVVTQQFVQAATTAV